ncbi:hypothetical protein [Pinisolibacter sp.]|uniref:hypothetical protein n=1 Tax=Pinisolibacter sp. TaxID=2172024 RepID=UPI002FDDD51A
MFFRSSILTGAALATALVLASTGAALAQAAGRGGGGGASSEGSDETRVLTYGLPGNCPPTVAGCGEVRRPKPVITKKRYDPCGDFAEGSAAYRECKRKK